MPNQRELTGIEPMAKGNGNDKYYGAADTGYNNMVIPVLTELPFSGTKSVYNFFKSLF